MLPRQKLRDPVDRRMSLVADKVLIARVAEGDQGAMQSLYARHATQVYRFLVRLVRNPTTAEDLMSDVFFDVWKQAARFEGRSTALTWMLSIARFKALSRLRARATETLDDDMAEAIEDEADDPEIAVQKVDKAGALRRCLEALSSEQAAVIDLVYYHERSVDEVGVILRIPTSTVKTRMFYARKRLSELLVAAGVDRGWP